MSERTLYLLKKVCLPALAFLLMGAVLVYFLGVAGIFIAIPLMALCWARQVRQKEGEIEQVIDYARKVSSGEYDLRLLENKEGAVSRLSNEVYKLMLYLREARELSIREKARLQQSLEDISHQLRTPLTAMQIMVDNMEDDPEMDPSVRQQFVHSIGKQLSQTSSQITTLLTLARLDSGSIQLKKEAIQVDSLLREAKENLQALADQKQIEIVIEGDRGIGFSGDYKWELEAISNLLKNAIEHSGQGARVWLTAEQNALFVTLCVRDEGRGIASADLPHIFERFYKSASSASDSIGIGLSFAKEIIERDGAIIGVSSVEGEGTCFTLRYPR